MATNNPISFTYTYSRIATKVVAANDSLDKANADYVCDGVNDQEEINVAINALPAFGGRVILLEGTYNISASITILKSNVILEGQGKSTKLFLVNGANANVIQVGNGGTTLSGIKIANLQIDGNKANQTATNINGIYFKGSSANPITESVIQNCLIYNAKNFGIFMYYASKSLIMGNQISECSYGLWGYGLSNSNVIGNIISNNYQIGFYIDYSNYVNFIGNHSYSNGNNGVLIEDCSSCIVIGNISYSNTLYGSGILLNNSSNCLIEGNRVSQNNYDGIQLTSTSSNNIVMGNYCNGNNQYGIRIFSQNCNNNLVVKNYCTGNIRGGISDSGTGTILAASTTNDNVV